MSYRRPPRSIEFDRSFGTDEGSPAPFEPMSWYRSANAPNSGLPPSGLSALLAQCHRRLATSTHASCSYVQRRCLAILAPHGSVDQSVGAWKESAVNRAGSDRFSKRLRITLPTSVLFDMKSRPPSGGNATLASAAPRSVVDPGRATAIRHALEQSILRPPVRPRHRYA